MERLGPENTVDLNCNGHAHQVTEEDKETRRLLIIEEDLRNANGGLEGEELQLNSAYQACNSALIHPDLSSDGNAHPDQWLAFSWGWRYRAAVSITRAWGGGGSENSFSLVFTLLWSIEQ